MFFTRLIFDKKGLSLVWKAEECEIHRSDITICSFLLSISKKI
ncbi:hypothetical protein XBKB1_570036 [Xenorhabdus bovienii str. kraussei Becker Underwood]|uniref:Uncharacterized protein n=1 Tax=Xenorhabdus bovienii str. kraussei Becker Underwood TaxID=1398204 RepID=A0A077Q042_XENBV|nr:hypothetical protein XBKB1_570036 [Xenorhabdus bovienii str. kraussei Becker Underwood]